MTETAPHRPLPPRPPGEAALLRALRRRMVQQRLALPTGPAAALASADPLLLDAAHPARGQHPARPRVQPGPGGAPRRRPGPRGDRPADSDPPNRPPRAEPLILEPSPRFAEPLSPQTAQGLSRRTVAGFLACVLLPLALLAGWLWGVARDQYASVTAFSVQREDATPSVGVLAGLAGLGQSSSSDTDILYDFLLSQDLAQRIDRRFDLAATYPRVTPPDPVFTLAPDASIEARHALWLRMITVDYDQGEGVISLTVRAGSAETAQNLARSVVEEATGMINALSDKARGDAVATAGAELSRAEDRLREARQALTGFRIRNQMVDPEDDLSSQMGVIGSLNSELATLMVELDLLQRTTRAGDPRIAAREEKLTVIRNRIAAERAKLGIDGGATEGAGGGYSGVMAEYEDLTVDREFAEQSWLSARNAMEAARIAAGHQSRYLATHIPPTLAETAEYPRRWRTLALAAFLLTLGWSILSLVRRSLRDLP